jgi:hypothetical protein
MRPEVCDTAKYSSKLTVVVQDISAVLREASHEDLVGARNEAYMKLYTANNKLSGSLETLE